MKKRLLIWGLVLLASLGLGITLFYWQRIPVRDNGVSEKEIAENLRRLGRGTEAPAPAVATPLEIKRPVRLAIGNLGLINDEQNRQLGDLVLAELTGAPGLNLVERQSLEAVLHELNMSLSGLVRANDAVRAGKLLKADWFLLGTEAKINGTNSIVIRVVDASTGILRDAGVFSGDKSSTQLVANIAAFVRQTRQNAASAKPRVYLAIGAFEDLSVNNRQAAFPTQLRSYLMAAYQGTNVTLLEREYVNTLLQEIRLDLAGLTEADGTNAPAAMQSAYWLIDGYYQSFETTNYEVEVVLNVSRMFGKWSKETFRGLPNEGLFQKIKNEIDAMMKKNSSAVVLSRVSETRAQMSAGKELAQLGATGLVWPGGYQELDAQEAARQHRNAEEAIKSFETVLLLEPGNREAKLYLAACLQLQVVGRTEEGRNYYREVLEEPVQDKWIGSAQQALHYSFRWSGMAEKLQWYEAAAQHAINPAAADFFRQEAEAAKANLVQNSVGSQAQELAEANLLKNITNALFGNIRGYVGADDLIKAFGTNQAAAANRLAEIYPKLKAQAPELAPYLLGIVVTAQVDTNAPVVAEFQNMLEEYAVHPDHVFKADVFWWDVGRSVVDWSFDHKLYGMAVKLMEGKFQAATIYPHHIWGINDEDKMNLAFAYLTTRQWEKALGIFETYSNQPVRMGNEGPWGPAFSMVFTSKEADYCRKKMNGSTTHNSQEFDMGKPLFCLCTPSTFTADDNGLWIGIGGQLLRLDFDLKTNLVVHLPMDAFRPITTICVTTSNLWIGTDGDGLIEFDKRTKKCRRFTVEDGLMMNSISTLHLAEDSLWIGYGFKFDVNGMSVSKSTAGGLGRLDLSARKFISFTPSMAGSVEALKHTGGNMVQESTINPTRQAIRAITVGAHGDVWFATVFNPLRRYRIGENVWEATPEVRNCSSFATDEEHLFAGQFSNYNNQTKTGPLGISVLDFKRGQWRSLKGAEGLPSGAVSTLTLDGKNLWAGGMGYIALVDPVQDKVLHFAYVQTDTVNRIQIGGGYVWAQFDWHLYRVPLSSLQ